MEKAISIILVVVLLMTVVGIAYGGIRCPSGGGSCLANVGDNKSVLYSCCGSPDMESSTVKVVKNSDGNGVEFVNVDLFIYNCGDGRFMKEVTMENNKITNIQDAGRGSGAQKCD